MEQIDLSDYFTTKHQATDFSARLSAIKERLYEVNFDLDKSLLEHLGSNKKDKFISFLHDQGVKTDSAEELSITLAKLQEHVSKMPAVALTLAIEPKEESLKAVSDWFLLNLKKQVLIDFKIDRLLIAGAVVDFQGKHHDASIKQTFESVCSAALYETP